MPHFSALSERRLAQCHPDIQRVLREVIKHFDFAVLVGFRDEEEQERCFHDGSSRKHWPDSKHNTFPTRAVDIAPYPVDWKDVERFAYLAGMAMAFAIQLGIKLRWGGWWTDPHDLPHLELEE